MSEKMNCIVVDDEPLARKGLLLLLDNLSYMNVVGEFSNALQAYEFLQFNETDVIFLDIEMPGLSGLDFLRSLPQKSSVILTTAYPQFALEAFELDVLDYLVKPIKMNRFIRSVSKAFDLHQLKSKPHELEEIGNDYIYVRSERKYVKLYYKDILYIKGLKDYVVINSYHKKFMTSLNIKSIGLQLPDVIFVRVSKSYIINVNKVQAIENDMIQIEEELIPLGTIYKDNFINNYVKTHLIKRNFN